MADAVTMFLRRSASYIDLEIVAAEPIEHTER